MRLSCLKLLLFSAFIQFWIGCNGQIREDISGVPTPLSTQPHSNQNSLEKRKENDTRPATVLDGPPKEWNVTQKRIGRDDWIDVSFVTADIGWIVAVKGYTIAPDGGSLFKTLNGGKTWRQIPLKLAKNSFISNINFVNRLRGWLIVQTIGKKSTKMQIMETSNGGKTWVPGFSLVTAIAAKMLISDSGEGWIIGIKGTATYEHDRKNLVLHTSDFGNSWVDVTPKTASNRNGEPSSSVLFEDIFTDINFYVDSRMVALSRDGKLPVTTDGGSTWALQTTVALHEKYSQGFSEFISLDEERFVVLSGANVPEGIWSAFSVIDDNVTKTSLLEDVFLSDMNTDLSGGTVTCGLRANWDKLETKGPTSAVVLTTNNFTDWQLLAEVSGGCKLACRFNKISKRGKGYCAVGSDGIIAMIDKKPDKRTSR